MNAKTCLVTGANTGIGYATTLGLAERGARVLMVVRSKERGEEALGQIIEMSGNPEVTLLLCDLSSMQAVRQLAADVQTAAERLDVLINNAAIIPQQRMLTVDGYEMQLAVNHLAPFLLTNLLLPTFKASAPARIINVSSQVHSSGRVDFDDLYSENSYHPSRVYSHTKLMNVLFTNELARRLQGTGVTANSLHPGVINTQLLNHYSGRSGRPVDLPDWRRGAETSLYLATSPEVAGISGIYFSNSLEARASATSQDEALAGRLWEVSAELVKL